MELEIYGDGSHLALVDTGHYASFIGDWSEDRRLVTHLVREMNSGHILAWCTDIESDWSVTIRPGISATPGFREFTGVIDNRSGTLHLVNYDSLTMAAQFEDHRLPDGDTVDGLPIPPGLHRVRVVQVSGPEDEDPLSMLIEYEPATANDNRFEEVPWLTWM